MDSGQQNHGGSMHAPDPNNPTIHRQPRIHQSPFNSQAHPPSDRPGFKPKLVLFSVFQRRARPIRRTLRASAPLANTKIHADDFAEHRTHTSRRPVAEYAPDTSAPSASTITVSRSLALSFQSAFQLSFTVLVCYRSRSHI